VNSETLFAETTQGEDSLAWATQAARNATENGLVRHKSTLKLASASGESTKYIFEGVK